MTFKPLDILSIQDEEIVILILGGIVLLILPSLIILSFIHFISKRKTQFSREKELMKSKFNEELLKSELEIREDELRYFARELHDNIGQLVSQLSMYHKFISNSFPEKSQEELKHGEMLINLLVSEVKRLSIRYEGKTVFENGLVNAINEDVLRLSKYSVIDIDTVIPESEFEMEFDCSVFVYRIYQELINNAMKYSNATKILIKLNKVGEENGELIIEDNGDGFDLNNIKSGFGISNIKERAKLINATVEFDTQLGIGTTIKLKFGLLKNKNEQLD